MLFAGHGIHLVLQHAQGADDARAGFARLDAIVHVAALGGDEGVGEALAEFVDLLPARGGLIEGDFQGLYGGRENGDDEQNWVEGVRFNSAETRTWSFPG